MARFRLGVNYWPRSSAMEMWRRFDLGEIDEDFARIAELGCDCVRFFLRWADFQPAPDELERGALENCIRVLDRAHAHGLAAIPTLFCGHMSGVNWLPEWTLDPTYPSTRFRTIVGDGSERPNGIGDFYGGVLLERQRFLARAVGERACDHAALLAWDLGNEFSNLREPRTPHDAARWSATLADDLRETSNAGATGALHAEDLERDRHIRPSTIAAPWPYATMHGYSVYSKVAHGKMDVDYVPFLSRLTAALARKAVLFSEFGNPTCPHGVTEMGGFGCLSEDEMARYARGVLEGLVAAGALGAMWWCWADYAHELANAPPFDRARHELTFGIVRADGTEKPVAEALRKFAAARCSVREIAPLAVDEERYYAEAPRSLGRSYEAYVPPATELRAGYGSASDAQRGDVQ